MPPPTTLMFRRLPGGGVLVDLESDRIFELNETGARIWEAWQDGHDVDAIAALLCAEFEIDPDAAVAATHRLLNDLRAAGLVPA